jgi:hypothetical protein
LKLRNKVVQVLLPPIAIRCIFRKIVNYQLKNVNKLKKTAASQTRFGLNNIRSNIHHFDTTTIWNLKFFKWITLYHYCLFYVHIHILSLQLKVHTYESYLMDAILILGLKWSIWNALLYGNSWIWTYSSISTWVRIIPRPPVTMEGGQRNQKYRRRPIILLQGLSEYLTESALHGVKYLAGGGLLPKICWVGKFSEFIPICDTKDNLK